MAGRLNPAFILATALAFILSTAVTLSGNTTASAVSTTVSISPSYLGVPVDGTASVDIVIEEVTDLYGAEVRLSFDHTKLEGIQIQPGSFLDPGQGFIARNRVDNSAGVIEYAIALLNPTPPVSGRGVLASITFKGIAVGASNLTFTTVNLVNSEVQAIPATASGAEVEVAVPITRSHTAPAGWNLFSLPLQPVATDFAHPSLLGDDVFSALYIHWWDPDIRRYKAYPLDGVPAVMGRGYWIKVYQETVIDATGLLAPQRDFTIHLKPGWNMIGHPFDYAVDWGKVKVTHDGTVLDVATAGSRPHYWITRFLYWYETENRSYQQLPAPEGKLIPWRGYWVRAYVECDLIIPAVPK